MRALQIMMLWDSGSTEYIVKPNFIHISYVVLVRCFDIYFFALEILSFKVNTRLEVI